MASIANIQAAGSTSSSYVWNGSLPSNLLDTDGYPNLYFFQLYVPASAYDQSPVGNVLATSNYLVINDQPASLSSSVSSTATSSVASTMQTSTTPATSPATSTTPASSPAASSASPSPTSSPSHTGAIAGGVVGGVAALALIGGIIGCLAWRKKRDRKPKREISQYNSSS